MMSGLDDEPTVGTTLLTKTAIDILILSNGPGELTTWVKPVVRELRQQFGDDRHQIRISVVLSPCANASGEEVAIATRYPEVDRVQGAEAFFPFLFFGQTQPQWDWRPHGVVLFLGGDQFFPVVIGKRLGYQTVVYAEWEARWHPWIDYFGVMQPAIATRAKAKYAHKFTVVGDLMAEAGTAQRSPDEANSDPKAGKLIGLLPGSKPMKLTLGVPLTLAIADQLHHLDPALQFVLPVAPSLDLNALARYADPASNPAITALGWGQGQLIQQDGPEAGQAWLQTAAGTRIRLWTGFPAHEVLAQCQLCLTTIGANTAELGALAVPMMVLIPTQQLDIMRAWDGLPGVLVNLPIAGRYFARLINGLAAKRVGLLAWPNIWAKREIVPELIGHLEPGAIAAQAQTYLTQPERLAQMRQDLRAVRGAPGAAKKLVQIVGTALGAIAPPPPPAQDDRLPSS